MRQSQAEIKAIEAELRSIRADSKVTLLDPAHRTQPADGPIAPTIDRQALMAASTANRTSDRNSSVTGFENRPKPVSSANRQRSVESFPVPGEYQTDYADLASSVLRLPQPRREAARPRRRTAQQLGLLAEQSRRQAQSQQLQSQQTTARLLLAEKASQINALSNQQEAVILELMSLSDSLSEQLDPELEPICEYESAEVPYIETAKTGTLLLTSRAVDLSALDTAEGTRRPYRLRKSRGIIGLLSSIALAVWRITWRTAWSLLRLLGGLGRLVTWPLTGLTALLLGQKTATASPRRPVSRTRPVETPFTLQEAVVLVVGSALLRIGLDWLVALYPILWIPSVLIMLTPAALAVYRSTLAPQTGFAWGYRLFSIMIGLLLGGRL